jgi:DNA polymerase
MAHPLPPTRDPLDPHEIIRFYLDAGVDTPMMGTPVNRLAETARTPTTTVPQRVPAVAGAPSPVVAASTVRLDHERLAAQASTLDELRAIMETQDICALKKTATQIAFSDGNPEARVMLVGEAPGRDEDLAGKPFVGRSGQLLDRMLAAIGLDRTQIYIANTVPWRPPGNRQPTAEETEQCLPFIRRQIELARPDLIMLIGGQSAKALLGAPQGIMQLRGAWTQVRVSGNLVIPALPTVHPAYLLRNPPHKRFAWADFISFRRRLDALPPRG